MNAVSPANATAIVLDADDDVATALVPLAPGARVTLATASGAMTFSEVFGDGAEVIARFGAAI